MEDYEKNGFSTEAGNETSASENEPTTPPSEAPRRVDGEYSFVRPQTERSAYSDAGYVPSEAASAVPRSYHCAPAPSEKKPKKEKRDRRGMPAGAVVALCVVCAILGGMAGGFLPDLIAGRGATEPPILTPSPAAEDKTDPAAPEADRVVVGPVESGGEMSATEIYYNLALKQVVGITTEITYTNYFGFTSSGAVRGSGFIISEDGYVLTNYHVIAEAVKGSHDIKVLRSDGTTYIAEVIGYEEENDVAVLKIDAEEALSAAVVGNSDEMLVGEQVYAIGNPLGELEYTLTSGKVSAMDREIRSTDASTGQTTTINMFQTDAAINSGNSGGPVYNSRGEVIGIATAKYSETGIEGLGFAIPINDAIRIANDLISDGYVRGKAYMGISVGTVTASAAQYYGLVEGAIVAGVTEGGCAEAAGLQESDIIVAIDGREITSREELIAAKRDYRAGDSAVLKVYRGGAYIELTIVFDEETPELLEADSANETQTQPQQPDRSYGSYYDFFNEFFGGNPFGR
ncbi:MAG: trypsin-like serine protease [Ruminococcaceae bacterium]|nr:trypsin-like serine protease [Oscillospiraceae bacterium]